MGAATMLVIVGGGIAAFYFISKQQGGITTNAQGQFPVTPYQPPINGGLGAKQTSGWDVANTAVGGLFGWLSSGGEKKDSGSIWT